MPQDKPKNSNGKEKAQNGADLGFEAELFKTADKLRGNMEPSDYKHVALGLIFLKHISDSFENKRSELLANYPEGAEDPDEYSAENVFWVSAGSSGWCRADRVTTGGSAVCPVGRCVIAESHNVLNNHPEKPKLSGLSRQKWYGAIK